MKKSIPALIFILAFPTFSFAQVVVDGQQITYSHWIREFDLGDGRVVYSDREGEMLDGVYRVLESRDKGYYWTAKFEHGQMRDTASYYRDGECYRQYVYENGERTCRIDYYPGGIVKERVELAGGKIHGMIRTYDPRGRLTMEREVSGGDNGNGIERHYDPETGGVLTDKFYVDGKPHGSWTVYTDERSYYETRAWDLREGEKVFYIRKCAYDMGVPVGTETETYMDGTPRSEKPRNADNQPHGRWFTARPDGQLVDEAVYENGLMLTEKVYYRNGSLFKETVTDGNARTVTDHYSDGNLKTVTRTVNGVVRNRKEYYPHENLLKAEYVYSHLSRDEPSEGTYKIYYENGKLKEEGRIDGGREIYKKEYYANGQLKAVLDFDGRWKVIEAYSESGEQLSDVFISFM